jgi:hypothetical protein
MEATAKQAIDPESCGGQDWIEQELAASTLPDAQLGSCAIWWSSWPNRKWSPTSAALIAKEGSTTACASTWCQGSHHR